MSATTTSTGGGGRESITVLVFVCVMLCVMMMQQPKASEVSKRSATGGNSEKSSSSSSSSSSFKNSSLSSSAEGNTFPKSSRNSNDGGSGSGAVIMPDETLNPAAVPVNGKVNDKFYYEDVWKPRARYGWKQRLNTPTYVTMLFDTWFIVSCWQHRILYRKRGPDETDADLDKEKDFVKGWKTLPIGNQSELVIPHSLASDGNVLVTESSIGGSGRAGEHSILVWEPVDLSNTSNVSRASPALAENEDWRLIQIVRACDPPGAALRPHRVLYDRGVDAFFLYLTHAMTKNGTGAQVGYLSRFDRIGDGTNKLKISWCKHLHFTAGAYARAISFYGRDMIVTLGPNYITRFSHRYITNATMEVPIKYRYFTRMWKTQRGQMNDAMYIDGFWYITQTADCRFFRQPKLPPMGKFKEVTIKKRAEFRIESLKNKVPVCRPQTYGRTDMCVGGGTPYFISQIGKRIYVTYIFGCSGIFSFVPSPNFSSPVTEYKHHFNSMGWAETVEDIERRGQDGKILFVKKGISVNAFFLYMTHAYDTNGTGIQLGHLSRFDRIGDGTNKLKIAWCKKLPFTHGAYARSISLYRGDLMVTLGPNYMSRFSHRYITNETVEVPIKTRYFTKQWKTGRGQMNDARFIDGFWYITQTAECRFFRVPKLPQLGKFKEITIKKRAEFKIESLKHKTKVCRATYGRGSDMCKGGGTPYFMSQIGKRIYVAYIFGCSGIFSFIPSPNTTAVTDYIHHFNSMGWAETVDDIERRGAIW